MDIELFISGSQSNLSNASIMGATFALISLAEIGDKSQLVCMTLAARHRGFPVLIGVSLAFIILNLLAVTFGASIAAWVPEWIVALIVGLLFAIFGIQMLRSNDDDDDDDDIVEKTGRSVLLTTFILIFMAEFGDKTQIAVAALSGGYEPISVWIGGTAALIFISALGVVAGSKLLRKIPEQMLHRISGIFFLVLAVPSLWTAASILIK
ncbi:MAG: TMEM165/GDT1 family protein [Magnetococcales bacterium]|nr:TMEM165/GDT1 family protein [Magnetococcales bacterium]